jgi:hypothetical protein
MAFGGMKCVVEWFNCEVAHWSLWQTLDLHLMARCTYSVRDRYCAISTMSWDIAFAILQLVCTPRPGNCAIKNHVARLAILLVRLRACKSRMYAGSTHGVVCMQPRMQDPKGARTCGINQANSSTATIAESLRAPRTSIVRTMP